jgi:hypothetical protein
MPGNAGSAQAAVVDTRIAVAASSFGWLVTNLACPHDGIAQYSSAWRLDTS